MMLEQLRTARLRPEAVAYAYQARRRRALWPESGRMLLVAADHPARAALGAAGDPMAMADRGELLSRLVTVLEHPGVDGVLGTPDILEDLLLLGALEGKLAFGSMNRGGLHGSVFEFDDRFTAVDAASAAAVGLDGAKMLCRIALDDPRTVDTLAACAQAISELAAHRLPAMIEPFWSKQATLGVKHDLSPEAVIRSVAVASGLGSTSAYTWLKLPIIDELERVIASTTLPTLLLGGDPAVAPQETYARWEKSLAIPGVRGLVLGRSLLYPRDADVPAAVSVAAQLVHGTAAGVA